MQARKSRGFDRSRSSSGALALVAAVLLAVPGQVGAATGDFNSDNRADILWRNSDSGNTVLWQMNGFVREAAGSIGWVSSLWRIDGIADFDFDSKADVLWRNWSTGNSIVWKMDGFVRDAAGGIGNVPVVWEVQ